MAEIKWDDIVSKVGEKIVNEYIYKDKSLREWIDLIVDYEPNKMQEQKTDTWSIKEVADALGRHGLLEREPKTGQWLERRFIVSEDHLLQSARCSKCAKDFKTLTYYGNFKPYDYCPNCGAKMGSEADNGSENRKEG